MCRVRLDIGTSLNLRRPLNVVASFDRPNLFYSAIAASDFVGNEELMKEIAGEVTSGGGSAIVYCPTKRLVEEVGRPRARPGCR